MEHYCLHIFIHSSRSGINICPSLSPIVWMKRKSGLRHSSSRSIARAETTSILRIGGAVLAMEGGTTGEGLTAAGIRLDLLATAIMTAADAARTEIAADLAPAPARGPDQILLIVPAIVI